MYVVGSSTLVSRACTGSVFSLKLSTVQTTHCESVLWNDCPISTVILAMAPIRASPRFLPNQRGWQDPGQPNLDVRHPGAPAPLYRPLTRRIMVVPRPPKGVRPVLELALLPRQGHASAGRPHRQLTRQGNVNRFVSGRREWELPGSSFRR